MQFSINIIILFNIFTFVSQSEISRRQNKLMTFRNDINKIGEDVENFIFDIAKEVVLKTDGFFYSDYETDYEDGSNEETSELPKQSDKMDELYKSRSRTNVKEGTFTDETNTARSNKNLETKNVSKIRYKRSPITDAPEAIDIPEEKTNNLKNSECTKDTPDAVVVERKHIEDLKEEVKKLYELVILLKDQQKILSHLEDTSDDSDISESDIEQKDLLTVLEHLNDDSTSEPVTQDDSFKKISEEPVHTVQINPAHKEMEHLKFNIKQTMIALNQTQDFLADQKKSEIALRKELQKQKIEISILKIMMKKLFQNLNFTEDHLKEKKVTDTFKTQVVGSPLYLPKHLSASRKEHRTIESKESVDKKHPRDKQNKNIARESDIDDISRFLKELDKPKLSDMEMELQENMEKKNKEENLKKLLILQKLMEKQQTKANSNFLPSNGDVSSRKLQLLLKVMNGPQGKTDDNLEDELEKLRSDIDKLRPEEEFTPLDLSKAEIEKLRNILNGKGRIGEQKKVELVTSRDILGLKKLLEQLTSDGTRKTNSMKENIDMKNCPPPYPLWYAYNRNFDRFSPYNNFLYWPNMNGYDYDGSDSYNYPTIFKPPGYTQNYLPYLQYPSYQQNYKTDTAGKNYREQKIDSELPKPAKVQPQTNALNDKSNSFLGPTPESNVYYRPDTDHINFSEDYKGGIPEQSGPYYENNEQFGDKTGKIEDLKLQMNSLQGIINNLNNPDLAKRPEDQRLIGNLEQQINELKNIVNSLKMDNTPIPGYVQPLPNNQQRNPLTQDHSEHRRERSVNVKKHSSESELYDDISRKLKSYFFDDDTVNTRTENESTDLKNQLDEELKSKHRSSEIYPQYYSSYPFRYPAYKNIPINVLPSKIQRKKDDFSTSLIVKIVDKIIVALPEIIEKLFGEAFYGFSNVGSPYSYSSNYNLEHGNINEIQKVLYNFGIVGYIPLVFLKVINMLNTFVTILKRNEFFKHFLLPVLVLALVSGSILFLIWWLQPKNSYSNYERIGYEPNQNYNGVGNYNDYKGANTNTKTYSEFGNQDYSSKSIGRMGLIPRTYSRTYEK